MITLNTILQKLKPEFLNEIVAGDPPMRDCGGTNPGLGGKSKSKSEKLKSIKQKSSKEKSSKN